MRVALAAALLLCAPSVAGATWLQHVKRIPVGLWPKALAISPDGERAYVAVHHDEQIAVISRKKLKVVQRADVGGRPEALALSPDGKRLWVSVGDRSVVQARNAESLALEGSVRVGPRPRGLAVSPDGRWLWVAVGRNGHLVFVDTASLAVRAEVAVGWSPRTVAYVPRLDRVLVVHAIGHSLYAVDPVLAKVVHRLKGFGRRPLDVAVSPDGEVAWVPSSKKRRVFRVRLESPPRIDGAVVVGKEPVAVALSRSGKTLFAALWGEGKIAIASTTRRGRPRKVRTGRGPIALAVSPSGKTLWAACFDSHEVWVYRVR